MHEVLRDRFLPILSNQKYIIYSLRPSYITNQIEEGKVVYLIKKLTAHSLDLLHRHYYGSNILKCRAEATSRAYPKTEGSPNAVDLENLASLTTGSSAPSYGAMDARN